MTNREKTTLVDALRPTHAIKELLAALDLARSSNFYHRGQICLGDRYADVRSQLVETFEKKPSLLRLPQDARLVTTDLHLSLGESSAASDEAGELDRSHAKAAPVRLLSGWDQSCAGDSDQSRLSVGRAQSEVAHRHYGVPDPAGKVYLSPVIDCFDGLVVSWSLGTSPDAELVNTMLDAAIETIASGTDRPTVHSDRGAHYRWPGRLSRTAEGGLVRSMSRKAYSPGNAACEGFFGRLKNELFYPGTWQSTTAEHFIAEVDSYIRWYNEDRIKISLGSRSPMEYRTDLGNAT